MRANEYSSIQQDKEAAYHALNGDNVVSQQPGMTKESMSVSASEAPIHH